MCILFMKKPPPANMINGIPVVRAKQSSSSGCHPVKNYAVFLTESFARPFLDDRNLFSVWPLTLNITDPSLHSDYWQLVYTHKVLRLLATTTITLYRI